MVTSSEVMWRASHNDSLATEAGTSDAINDFNYTINELESNTSYSITIKVINVAGSNISSPVNVTTNKGDVLLRIVL